ncbi:hypothetical protein MAPG_09928 [Magnaporthiopsis poae ATCC 64411]|uniref:Uncharacterized protein n=1 Tax=Magnaporthiopsis poae (strain ATCC 64411 / 73-15) TaxID=644358 RepID=A0A0C4EB81_MAGP6|nr:hypothetical protein MAPG_09928 [Magnaporthiopsis poae ATCC 64411]
MCLLTRPVRGWDSPRQTSLERRGVCIPFKCATCVATINWNFPTAAKSNRSQSRLGLGNVVAGLPGEEFHRASRLAGSCREESLLIVLRKNDASTLMPFGAGPVSILGVNLLVQLLACAFVGGSSLFALGSFLAQFPLRSPQKVAVDSKDQAQKMTKR